MWKYDTNGNGKIDVEERKGCVRERARLLQEDVRRDAALRLVTPPELRQWLEVLRITTVKSQWRDDIWPDWFKSRH